MKVLACAAGLLAVPECSTSGGGVAFRANKCSTDRTATTGVTYHYIATGTDTNGNESPNSTEVGIRQ